jgi:hypothetical protein
MTEPATDAGEWEAASEAAADAFAAAALALRPMARPPFCTTIP